MLTWEKNLNALQAILLSCVLFGAFGIQYFYQEEPCPLCLLQRLGMLGVASGALMNVKFGPHKAHYGLSLLCAVFGSFVALRQIALHVCPDFPTFGLPFWGLDLYIWSFIVFASSFMYIALLLLIFPNNEKSPISKHMNLWSHCAFLCVFGAATANIVTTYYMCHWGAC